MKGFLSSLLITFWAAPLLFGQVEPDLSNVKKSNNKVSLGGKPYYIHIVRKGESLTKISKAYQVPIDTLKKDNLHLNDSLKINQYLKIRINENPPIAQPEFIFHTVVKGDTPYNLAIKYQIKIDEIYANNPDAKLGIKIGDVLKIPVIKMATTPRALKDTNIVSQEVEATDNEFIYHKVEKSETIFRLTQLYHIKEKQLVKLNPELKNRGLKEGELIRIPKSPATENHQNQEIVSNTTNIPRDVERDHYGLYKDSLVIAPCPDPGIDKLSVYKVAFFLPLYLNVNDTLGKFVDIITKDNNGNEILETVPRTGRIDDKIYSKSKIFLEFYQGILISLLDLKKMGTNLEVKIIDTRNDSTYLAEIMKKEHLEDFDLFIGPVLSENLTVVGDFAWEHRINIVSPLSLKSGFIDHNPFAFQVAPPFDIQMQHASDFLNAIDTKNYIVIHDGNNLEQEYISEFKKQLYAQMNSTNLDQIKYNEVFYYDAQDSVLKEVFTPGIKNIVIVPSGDQAFVTDVMGKLNGYSYEYDITVFGQPRWLRFDNIELENFHNTNTHVFSNSFIDYSKPEVIDFVEQYRHYYKGEPDKYSFQAYDITKFFCLALNRYGRDFRKCQHSLNIPLLQTNFHFVPVSDQGGYQNTAIYMLEFTKDFKLVNVASFPN
ncbi:MAG TPA: hypothetical protein DCQ26_06880 [Marinilabiliales bacterium]|nr:MAG: hypothetical protein A2W84_17725 [Bacteroidetes bacterium GWC2_40_13]OFX71563.1 MAG: hypothetical protein A2W96_10475 [Bacteroidetes bacterium GWD2_40_43]OFX95597.1 MAG: hypothetical protein A2W97_00795 [Bacteroidetes bacterium GWE2_40_63]OFY22245.1 MAG: hypothetical protein A2W88_06930 [Bacteroidetes bacterium GWF2_40_13]OFZ24882.1 MAG: hypothetical protein A2437_14565 [Bacteroidetes bacterium RIFOXYC2_FULL_40_12]HAM98319.1 hypothetical protein [Marinilabiliales bacterium]